MRKSQLRLSALCAGFLTFFPLAGCETESEPQAATEESWESFRAAATRHFEGEEFYILDWDIRVTLEQVREAYLKKVGGATFEREEGHGAAGEERSLVHLFGGNPDIWNASVRMNLTYCVSNDFGGNHGRMVNEMANATAAWEAAAAINFIYQPAANANCNTSNSSVLFSVRPWPSGGGASAFFPSYAQSQRTLLIDIPAFDNNYHSIAPNLTTEGVLRHELGHILGVRHEHAQNSTCAESGWGRVTTYDQGSVMHYQWCDGQTWSHMQLTAADRRGIAALYGPVGMQAPQAGLRVALRHAQTGKCIYANGGDGGTGNNDGSCWADSKTVFVLDDAGGGGYRLRQENTAQCLYTQTWSGGTLYHWGCWNDPAMVFDLIPYYGGYRIRNRSTNQSLIGNPLDSGTVTHSLDTGNLNMIYFAETKPCTSPVTWWTGTPIIAGYDSANCYVAPATPGTTPFIWANHYYTNALVGTQCILGTYSGNGLCFVRTRPSGAAYIDGNGFYSVKKNVCPSGSEDQGDRCLWFYAPTGTEPVESGGNWYVTALRNHCPAGNYDGANCWMGTPPAGSRPFIWANNFYYESRW